MFVKPFVLLLAVLVLLAGCASQTPQEVADNSWPERAAQLALLQNWQADGKMALRGADGAESSNITWQQEHNHTRVKLSGSMGLSATTIYSDGSFLEVNRAGEISRYDISSPESIIRDIGWDLPLQSLPYWLKGLPSPLAEAGELTLERGLLTRLQQSGWLIHYENYAQFGLYVLPKRLEMERGTTRLRLIIRNWTIAAG